MTKKGIIYETLGSTAKMQIMESGNSDEILLHGVFGVCGIKNGNNRIYEKSNYSKMVNILQEQMKSEAVLGELEHPNTMNITLENVSHKIEEITMNEDGTVTGTIRLLSTPKGKIAKAIIEGGCPLYISSRGAGSIDESGHVTLTTIKTYDLVGTPGFSQAKLTLKKDQKFEALNESLENPAWMIVESEEPDANDKQDDKSDSKSKEDKQEDKQEDNKNNNGEKPGNNVTMEDIKKSVDELTEKVQKLEAELHIAKEAKESAENMVAELQSKQTVNYAAIQEWIEKEFAPEFKSKINEELSENAKDMENGIKENLINWMTENYSESVQKWIVEQFAPAVQSWTVNEFGKEIESWVSKEYSTAVQEWLANEFAPVVEKWITEEYTEGVSKWITEEFAPNHASEITEAVNQNINEFFEAKEADNKYSSIDTMLEKLSKSVDNEAIAEEILESQQNNKYAGIPVIEGMPANYRPLWEALSDEKKDAIIRESRMYDMTKKDAVAKFWSTRQLTAETIVESRAKEPESNVINNPKSGIFKQMKQLGYKN